MEKLECGGGFGAEFWERLDFVVCFWREIHANNGMGEIESELRGIGIEIGIGITLKGDWKMKLKMRLR